MDILERLGISQPKRASRRRHLVQSFKAKADAKRTHSEKFADWMTAKFGTVKFLTFNALFFAVWLLTNTGFLIIKPFDPFPFGLLTTIVSLEAIFLAIIVLISQNRASHIAELREEIDLQINMLAEEEVSKIIELLVKSLEKQGVDVTKDEQIQQMLNPKTGQDIERKMEKELDENSNSS